LVRPMPGDGFAATSDALFVEIKRKRSSDDVVTQIREAIIAEQLVAGQRLPNERELCRLFGVSRATLREGLRTLEALGAIEIRPGAAGGAFVCEPQGDQVGAALDALLRFRGATAHELAEFRVSFETETARWAALRADEEDCSHLEELAARFIELAGLDDLQWRALAEVDVEFHEAVARASKNQVRVAIMLGIQRALMRAEETLAGVADSAVRKSIGRELGQIAAAITAHDAARATSLRRRHVKKFSELESEVETARG
jgi:GntR family transcriptional regulator, transcriptional repressor for pyruvate dehydrogenase complex